MFHKFMKLNLQKLFFFKHQKRCFSLKPTIKSDVYNFFQHNLELSKDEIIKCFNTFPSLYMNNVLTLSENYFYLMNSGISKEDIIKHIKLLTLHPFTVKNRYLLLEEGGFTKCKISTEVLLRFNYLSKKSIVTLKDKKYINKSVDVQHNILSFIEFPKELFPNYCDESLSWDTVQNNVFKLYLEWKIKMNSENLERSQVIYHRLHNKSFRIVEKSINIMLDKFNFTEEKIRRNSYLIHSDPDNTLAILNNFKQLCGLHPIVLLRKHPKVILTYWRTIEQIQNHFKEFGIPESALAKAPEVYTLGSNSVYERLSFIKNTPELSSYLNNPQVAKLVYYITKVKLRLKYLKNKNCISLNLLASNNSSFKRFNLNGSIKVKTNDIMIYLVNELGEDKKKLRASLERHPYWQYISLLTIRQSYEYLKNKNFTNDQLCQCIQILLYPVNKIEDALVTTYNMKNVSYLRNSSGSIKSEFILSLVLYNLEKDFHFSGNGVWVTEQKNDKITVDPSKEFFKDTEELDHIPSTSSM